MHGRHTIHLPVPNGVGPLDLLQKGRTQTLTLDSELFALEKQMRESRKHSLRYTLIHFIWTDFPKLRFMALLTLATTLFVFFRVYLKDQKNLDSIFNLMCFLTGLVLMFYHNQMYERWWEGRCAWGKVMYASRELIDQGLV